MDAGFMLPPSSRTAPLTGFYAPHCFFPERFDGMQPLHYHRTYAGDTPFFQLPGAYQRERPPATHFHVQLNDGREAWVRIEPLEIIHGRVAAREIAEGLAWAAERQAWLAEIFEDLQR
jgi:hypothetical protein